MSDAASMNFCGGGRRCKPATRATFSRQRGGGQAIRCSFRRPLWWRLARGDRPPRGRATGITDWSPVVAEARRRTQAISMHGRADEVSELLKLLGNPQRLLIACLLCEGEYAVSEIEEKLGIRK